MKIVREEIFGPVVVAEPFRSLDEIAAEANNTSYGLGHEALEAYTEVKAITTQL